MRLPLTAVLLAWSAATAYADGRAATWVSVYSDDDDLTVVSPQLSVRSDVGQEVEVEAGYDVDIISAASIDVVTAASPRGYEERRHGLTLGATWRPALATTLSLSYFPSWEADYRSHGVLALASREWIDRRLTTAVDLRVTLDRVGRAGEPSQSWRDLQQLAVGSTAAWVFDRWTIGRVIYQLTRNDGFMASPYRFVDVTWTDTGMEVSVPEAVPDGRTRHAVSANLRRALGKRLFASGSYRLYADSWGVVSHTGEVEVQRTFDWDRLIVGIGARGYRQAAADFYERSYQAATGQFPELRAADKMLAESWSVLGSARGEVNLGAVLGFRALRLTLKLEYLDQHFIDFELLDGRRGLIGAMGATAEY